MADDKDNKLLNEIKNYLEITWDDSLGDEKMRGMVKRGMAAISGKIGECNFYEETQEKALLFDYVPSYCSVMSLSIHLNSIL